MNIEDDDGDVRGDRDQLRSKITALQSRIQQLEAQCREDTKELDDLDNRVAQQKAVIEKAKVYLKQVKPWRDEWSNEKDFSEMLKDWNELIAAIAALPKT